MEQGLKLCSCNMFLMSLLPIASDSWIMTHQKASWSNSTVLWTPRFVLLLVCSCVLYELFFFFHRKKKCHQLFTFTLDSQTAWTSTGKSQNNDMFLFCHCSWEYRAARKMCQCAMLWSRSSALECCSAHIIWRTVSYEGQSHLQHDEGFRQRMLIPSKEHFLDLGNCLIKTKRKPAG